MDGPFFTFQPGQFVEVEDSLGNRCIAQITSIENDTISVNWWAIDAVVPGIDSLLLPKDLLPTFSTNCLHARCEDCTLVDEKENWLFCLLFKTLCSSNDTQVMHLKII